jgi:hypothetical protein
MSRPPNIIPSVDLHVTLPQDLKQKLDLMLFSEVEQRIPKGAYQQFFCARLREWMELRNLDLAPWSGGAPGEWVLKGRKEALAWLTDALAAGENPQGKVPQNSEGRYLS